MNNTQQKQYTAIFKLRRIFFKLILLLNSNRYVLCCNKWCIKVWNQKPNNLQTWQCICHWMIISFNWGRCLVNNGQTHDVHLVIWYLLMIFFSETNLQQKNLLLCSCSVYWLSGDTIYTLKLNIIFNICLDISRDKMQKTW